MSGARFRYFVMFAEMRTGSNFLEQNINQFSGLHCHGELFNPHFVGKAKNDALFGVTLKERERDPERLIDIMLDEDKEAIPGFRFFHDHDPRIMEKCLADNDCAKIILSRNPLDSYVSRKIAEETGQWKLTNVKHRKQTMIEFDYAEFKSDLDNTRSFQDELKKALQASGQTAFHVGYDDLQSLEVLNGLAGFLGVSEKAASLDKGLKKQNSSDLKDKVSNYQEMVASVGSMEITNLSHRIEYEPRRGAAVPSVLATSHAPLLFLPIKGGPVRQVSEWMALHDKATVRDLVCGFNQKTLRKWRRERPGFQSFTVLRHPLERAYFSFCEYILSDKHASYRGFSQSLVHTYKIRVPGNGISPEKYDLVAHRDAFLAFLDFLKLNIANQTGVRVDPAWCSQSAVIEGASKVLPVMHIIHEQTLDTALQHVESLLQIAEIPLPTNNETDSPFLLSDIYTAEIELAVRQIYSRDYISFGFGDWRS